MNYPVNIRLTKLETLEDAEFPQEDKYPSNETIREGLMWEFSLPKIDNPFYVYRSKLDKVFVTSVIKNIDKINQNTIILKTLNSKYKLEILS